MDAEEFQNTQLLRMYEEQEEEDIQDNDNFEVEKIMDRKIEKRKKFYLIKWLGYPESANTWEPLNNLKNIKNMVKEFDNEYEKEFYPENLELGNTKKKKNKVNSAKNDNKNNKNESFSNESIVQSMNFDDVKPKRNHLIAHPNNNFVTDHDKTYINSKRSLVNDSSLDKLQKQIKSSESQEIEDNLAEEGNLAKDEPLEIMKIIPFERNNSKYMCLVKWKLRSDGIQAKPSYVDNETIKRINPMLLVLFFENSLRFIK